MQPFPSDQAIAADPKFFFRHGASWSNVTISTNIDGTGELAKGCTVEIPEKKSISIDTDMLNMDPIPETDSKGATSISASYGHYCKGGTTHLSLPIMKQHEVRAPVKDFFGLVGGAKVS
ncbi:hypothetical protein FRB94_009698 [Tulasnella sp. JGI-2019a]|nr:hypothetical protein FRB94_009698 [Tulasnella sp. JGI-2019a]